MEIHGNSMKCWVTVCTFFWGGKGLSSCKEGPLTKHESFSKVATTSNSKKYPQKCSHHKRFVHPGCLVHKNGVVLPYVNFYINVYDFP